MYSKDNPKYKSLGSEANIEVIERNINGQWVEWLLVAESALLRQVKGLEEKHKGLGVYALRHFKPSTTSKADSSYGRELTKADEIGYYGGRVLFTATTKDELDAWRSSEKGQKLLKGRRHLLPMRLQLKTSRQTVLALVDGAARSRPPYLHLVNDPRGSQSTGANCRVNAQGLFLAAREIKPMDLSKALDKNWASELSFDYANSSETDASGYWDNVDWEAEEADACIDVIDVTNDSDDSDDDGGDDGGNMGTRALSVKKVQKSDQGTSST